MSARHGLEVFAHSSLHIFLLSLFVIASYYLRVAPGERLDIFSQRRRIPHKLKRLLTHALQQPSGHEFVCAVEPERWRAEVLEPIDRHLRALGGRSQRLHFLHDKGLLILAICIVLLTFGIAALLFYLNKDKLKVLELLGWGLLTFLCFTLLEFALFRLLLVHFRPITNAQGFAMFLRAAESAVDSAPPAAAAATPARAGEDASSR